jgi:aryl-alcohol dehydrogenase-like predicted oxidoreductase
MKYSFTRATGIEISKISLGTLIIKNKKSTLKLFDKAFSQGVNYFDTSDGYQGGTSEIVLGEFIRNQKRENILIGSKAYFPRSENILEKGLTKKNIFHSVEKSLINLNTDYLDIFYCHRFDNNTPIEETLDAIESLIRQGKILSWGVCGFSVFQLCKMYFRAREKLISRPSVAQYAYNLFNRSIEIDMSEALKELNVDVLSYYPLAQGVLTAKYSNGIPKDSRAIRTEFKKNMWDLTLSNIEKAKKLSDLASKLNTTSIALAINWCLFNENIKSVITSASSIEQLNQILAFEQFELTEEIKKEIEFIFDNHPVNQYTGIKY